MGTKKLTAEELARKYEERAAKALSRLPRTYSQFCSQCQASSAAHLTRMVYSHAAKNTRSAMLKRMEKLEKLGKGRAQIVNRARTATGYPYAVAVHEGRDAMTAPTPGGNGKLALAWLWNRASARPTTGKGWRKAVKAGLAVVVKSVGPVSPRQWRTAMVEEMKGQLSKMMATDIMRIMEQ